MSRPACTIQFVSPLSASHLSLLLVDYTRHRYQEDGQIFTVRCARLRRVWLLRVRHRRHPEQSQPRLAPEVAPRVHPTAAQRLLTAVRGRVRLRRRARKGRLRG